MIDNSNLISIENNFIYIKKRRIGTSIYRERLLYFLLLFFSQYVEDDEDGQSDDGDGSTSPKPFDK